jgi:hypothetical protein
MTRVLGFLTLFVAVATSAAAQTEGRVGVGGSVGYIKPSDNEVKGRIVAGPLVRLNPRKGWGLAGGLSWFSTDVENPSGSTEPFARLRVRPLMAGVAYTIGEQPALISFSIVAGPSFNKLDFDDDFVSRLPAGSLAALDVETSFGIRPGVSLTYTVAPRVALTAFGGYMINRPDVVYRDANGTEFRNRWKADSAVVSVGAVYSIF